MPGTSDKEFRDIAQQIEQDNPRRIIVFGVYTRQFVGFPRFPAPPGSEVAALWIPVGADAASSPEGYDARLAAATGPWTSRFRAFDAALDRHHPAGTAHWHLAILAVRPDRQGRGTGSALLAVGHAVLDQVPGPPAYLEASSPRARDLYLAHGYALLPGAPFHLPGDGPPLWPMWRPAYARAGAAARRPGVRAAGERM